MLFLVFYEGRYLLIRNIQKEEYGVSCKSVRERPSYSISYLCSDVSLLFVFERETISHWKVSTNTQDYHENSSSTVVLLIIFWTLSLKNCLSISLRNASIPRGTRR